MPLRKLCGWRTRQIIVKYLTKKNKTKHIADLLHFHSIQHRYFPPFSSPCCLILWATGWAGGLVFTLLVDNALIFHVPVRAYPEKGPTVPGFPMVCFDSCAHCVFTLAATLFLPLHLKEISHHSWSEVFAMAELQKLGGTLSLAFIKGMASLCESLFTACDYCPITHTLFCWWDNSLNPYPTLEASHIAQ